MSSSSNPKHPETTDWLSLAEQQIWFDRFKSPGEDSIGLRFSQFQEFLEATIYRYFARYWIAPLTNPSEPESEQSTTNSKQVQDNNNRTNKFTYQQELQLFKAFDVNNDHLLDRGEFANMCQNWLDKTYNRRSALVVVDVQNDFIDGSLALINGPAGQDGVEVVPVINRILDNCPFDAVVYTQDWHPLDHIGFLENLHMRKFNLKHQVETENSEDTSKSNEYRCKFKKLAAKAKVFDVVLFDEGKMEQKLWPVHCVQNSWGAELHPKLKIMPNSIRVFKGALSHVDAYSAFWDNMRLNETGLRQELISRKISDVFFCGLALDYCVSASALDSAKSGFMTLVIEDACRGIDLEEIKKSKQKLVENGVLIINSNTLLQEQAVNKSYESLLSLVKNICFKRAVDRIRFSISN